MALHNVPESDAFDTNVQMPADGDPADSSDLEASTIRPLTNRARWLKNKIDALVAWVTGGTVSPAGAVTVDEDLTVTGDFQASRLIGTRNLRLAAPTASTSYNHASAVDVVFVVRTSLAAGTTTITVSDTGRKDGDAITIVVGGASAGKNVDIQLPSASPISTGDTNTVRYTFMRAPGGGPWTQIW